MTKIVVSDLVKSYEFYTQVIGLKLVTSPDISTAKAPTANDPEKDFTEIPLNYSGSMADPLFVLIKRRGQKPSPESTSVVNTRIQGPRHHRKRAAGSAGGLQGPTRRSYGRGNARVCN